MNGATLNASWTLVTAPIIEPVDVTEARDHARYSQTNNDAALGRFLIAARQAAEDYMARALLTQTWKLVLNDFYNEMYLPMAWPLQSVTTVKYYDLNATLQTLSSTVYDVDTSSRPGRVTLAVNQTWPTLVSLRRAGRVEITYVAGYTAANLVPEKIKNGIRMYLSYLDSNRDGYEGNSDQARKAALACWDDRVRWIEPDQCYALDAYREPYLR
jgi:uncharacterized phiE125 gp8 family phage protein